MERENVIGVINKNIKKRFLFVISAYVFAIFVFGMWAFKDIVSFDAEGFYSLETGKKWYDQWLVLGRWGFVLLKKILGVTSINPFFSITVFFICFPMSIIIWNILLEEWSGRKSNLASAVFLGLYMTNTVWALQFAYRNQIEVCSIVMVLLPVGVAYFGRYIQNRLKRDAIIAYIILTFSCGCYQSFFVMYMEGALLFFFYYLIKCRDKEIPVKKIWNDIFRAFIFTIIIFASYLLITKITYLILGINTLNSYTSNQLNWTKQSLAKSVSVIWDCIVQKSFGNQVFTAIYGIECLCLDVLAVIWIREKKQYRVTMILLVVFLELCPYALIIATATENVDRALFGYGLGVAALSWLCLTGIYELLPKTNKKILYEWICLASIICFVMPQMQLSTRLLWTDVRVLERDYEKMSLIYEKALSLGAKEGDAICFTGTKENRKNDSFLEYEVVGVSYFEADPTLNFNERIIDAMQAYGYIFVYPSEEQVEIANENQKDMPCWPQEGGIKVNDGLVIVKLGDNNILSKKHVQK
ncbi:glucosyltransferase domain-containing protein [Butyrivibrio sp. AE3004]|uniref:glucosyltransferase domain-containing protein n=1 Tax=Butyrivibrio sp. AE3004 TaxID=1506994 RepID=UPI000494AAC5|nr:glucosyltransferase domain-containing protein [Butyrivibrio sp. AE3004]